METFDSAQEMIESAELQIDESSEPKAEQPQPTYVKLAMRNMVRKRGTSLTHFALTAIGLLAILVGLSYLTR